jgi:hypothetical protein
VLKLDKKEIAGRLAEALAAKEITKKGQKSGARLQRGIGRS